MEVLKPLRVDPDYEQPKTFGCHHYAKTCGNCEDMVKRWEAKRAMRAAAVIDDVSSQVRNA